MQVFDPLNAEPLYHGGSFNGHLLGSIAGTIAVRDLTAPEIARIDALGDKMRAAIHEAADAAGLPVRTSGVGSAFGLYVLDEPEGNIDRERSSLLHLAAVTHGVYYGSGGEFGLSTALDDETAAAAVDKLRSSIDDVAKAALESPSLREPV